MQVWEGVILAMQQLRSEKLKSFFSLIGVILGVMFLIVVVTIIEGLDRYVREEVTSQVFGVSTVTLRRWPEVDINSDEERWRRRMRAPRLRYEDAEAIRARLTIPARIAIQSSSGGTAVADNGRTATGVQLIGASPEVFPVRNLKIDRGRAFTEQEATAGTPVLVLGFETSEVLFEDLDPIGHTVRLRGFPYRVIGVLEERGSLFGMSLDNFAVAPHQSPIQAVLNPPGIVDEVIIQTVNPDRLLEAQMEAEGIMRTRRLLRPSEANNFALETADDAISFWDNISRILFTALPGLVAISLVVGGIVIMNIMLVSVMERTREIGIRKAIGAKKKEILEQFLIESVLISFLGGGVGVLLGIAISEMVSNIGGWDTIVSTQSILLAFGFSVGIGIFFGFYPANKAANMNPIEALRYE